MRINKKGVSPLIATVLLIAFVIIIAILVWVWYRDTIETELRKTEVRTEAELACSREVEISLGDVRCVMSGSNKTILFDVENTGTLDIDLFKIRFYDDDFAVSTIDFGLSVYEGTEEQFSVNLESDEIDSIEVLPVILKAGNTAICEEQGAFAEIDMSDC
jgi:flagellin-like protein